MLLVTTACRTREKGGGIKTAGLTKDLPTHSFVGFGIGREGFLTYSGGQSSSEGGLTAGLG